MRYSSVANNITALDALSASALTPPTDAAYYAHSRFSSAETYSQSHCCCCCYWVASCVRWFCENCRWLLVDSLFGCVVELRQNLSIVGRFGCRGIGRWWLHRGCWGNESRHSRSSGWWCLEGVGTCHSCRIVEFSCFAVRDTSCKSGLNANSLCGSATNSNGCST